MRTTHCIISVALLAVLIPCPDVSFSQQSQGYIATAGNQQIRFVAQPEAGYVIKAQERAHRSSTFWGTLSFLQEKFQIPFNRRNLLKITGECEPQACPERSRRAYLGDGPCPVKERTVCGLTRLEIP